MRKIGLIAATTVASISVAGVAHAIDVNQAIVIKTTAAKGTKAKPKALKLDVLTTTSAKDPSKDGTYATKKAVIHFDKNLKFNNKVFPTCDETTVAKDAASCPKGSLVGTGGATAKVGTIPTIQTPSIAAYNGAGGTFLLKLTHAAGQLDSDYVIKATLKKDSGKFGSKLDVPIPAALQEPAPGLIITLKTFKTVISTKPYKGKSYVTSVGCAGGSYKFGGDFTFSDGTSEKVTDTAKC